MRRLKSEVIGKDAVRLGAYLLASWALIGGAAGEARMVQSVALPGTFTREAWQQTSGQKEVTARSVGGRLILTSNVSLSDYAAYRRDERFYVIIPHAKLANAAAVRALPGASAEGRGDDLVLSFRLRPDSGARVNQRFNRLEIIFTGPGSTAVNSSVLSASDADRSSMRPEEKRREEGRQKANSASSSTASSTAIAIQSSSASSSTAIAIPSPEVGEDRRPASEAKVEDARHPAIVKKGWLVAALIFALLLALLSARALSTRSGRRSETNDELRRAEGGTPEFGSLPDRESDASPAREVGESQRPMDRREDHLPMMSEDRTDEGAVETRVGIGAERREGRAAGDFREEVESEEELWRSIATAFDDPIRERREEAARALVQIAERSAKSRAEIFARALLEADAERRRRIGEAICSAGLADEAISRLGNEDEEAREAFALLFVLAKAGELEPLARAIRESESNRIRLTIVRLLALCDHPDVLPTLKRLVAQTELPSDVRSALMEAIYQQSSAKLSAERRASG
jgi:hypothetical protein